YQRFEWHDDIPAVDGVELSEDVQVSALHVRLRQLHRMVLAVGLGAYRAVPVAYRHDHPHLIATIPQGAVYLGQVGPFVAVRVRPDYDRRVLLGRKRRAERSVHAVVANT